MASIQMTGMASGLDTKSIVESMLETEKLKVEKLNKEKQKLEWKQESYRELITSVKDFHKKYFDPLNKETYLLSSNALSGIKATSSVDANVADISAVNSTTKGNFVLNVKSLAKKAQIVSNNVINQTTVKGELKIPTLVEEKNNDITIDGEKITVDSKSYESTEELMENINSKIQANDKLKDKYVVSLNSAGEMEVSKKITVNKEDSKVKINVDSKSYDIEIEAKSYSPSELANEVESKLKSAVGSESSDKLKVEVKDGQVVVNNKQLDGKLKFEKAKVTIETGEHKADTNKISFSSGFVKGKNSELVISIKGKDPVIVDLSTVDTSKGTEEVLKEISKKINAKTKDDLKANVIDGKLTFKAKSDKQIVISGSAAQAIGIGNSLDITLDINKEKMINLIDFNHVNKNQGGKLDATTSANTNKKVEFSINGQTFKYDFSTSENKDDYKGAKDLTVKQIFSDISSKADVNLSYNTISRKFSIESKETGKQSKLEFSDTKGNFLYSLFGKHKNSDVGENAEVEFSDSEGNKNSFEFESNNFTLSDINFNLKSLPTEPIKVSVTSDTENTVKSVKQFVEDYNKIIDNLNIKTKEKVDRNYQPLTEEEKKEMSEKEIELWEKKAKKGLLGNETQIESFMYQLRSAIFTPVEGVPINFKDMGFDTSNDYTQGGKIQFDEEKFKSALMKDPESVSNLFTKTSDSGKDVYDPDLTPEEKLAKNKDQGILRRLNDIINDYVRTSRNDSGKKGIFIEIAGITGDTTIKENNISRSIIEFEKRINTVNDLISSREKRYYAQFTNMERALSELQSQMSIFGVQ